MEETKEKSGISGKYKKFINLIEIMRHKKYNRKKQDEFLHM